jgi:hypothetical protein
VVGLAVLALIVLGSPGLAVAKPTVTLDARAVPIPKNLLEPHSRTWPRTGDVAGEGAEIEAQFTIAGTENVGLPNPLRRVTLYLPKGTGIHTAGFARCKHPSQVPRKGPPCSSGSLASAPGPEQGMVDFGGTNAPTEWEQGAFFPVGGTLGFWTRTTEGPLTGGGYNTGSLTPTAGAYGVKITETMPVRTVLSAPYDLSTVSLDLTLGAAYARGKTLTSILTLPKVCPAGGLPAKAELSFGVGGELTWETVGLNSKLSCSKG